jgi:dTMP kinase
VTTREHEHEREGREDDVTGRGNSGRFIVFEGIDGSGTTTQAERYARYLRGKRRVAHVTREPSDGPVGALLRLSLAGRVPLGPSRLPQIMGLLFAADRLDHLANEIEPHLREGAVVLSDRYDLSSIAYQWASAGPDAPPELSDWLRDLNRHARRPDVTLVLDVSPETAARRRLERHGAVELYEEPTLQARLADLYRDAKKLVPGDNVILVDGNGPLDDVAAAVVEALRPFVEA